MNKMYIFMHLLIMPAFISCSDISSLEKQVAICRETVTYAELSAADADSESIRNSLAKAEKALADAKDAEKDK